MASAEAGAAVTERWPLFDVLRVAAALGVVVSHALPLTGGRSVPIFTTPGQPHDLGWVCLGAFFVLSGWLITASWGRNNAGQFAVRRFARIMPGLVAATLFGVVVVGPLVTSRSLVDYFGSWQTWNHLLNNVLMRPLEERGLPGVFEGNPVPGIVNGSLWTLPHEAISYLAVAALGVMGMLRRNVSIVLALAVLVMVQVDLPHSFAGATGLLWDDLAVLGAWFLLGSALYLWRDRLVWSPLAAVLAAACAVAANGTALALLPVAYLIAYVGTRPSSLRLPAAMGDPSYGIYVYAFPVQQVLAAAGVGVVLHIAIALPVVTVLGVLSWRWIESPTLRHSRRRLSRLVGDRPSDLVGVR